MDLIVTRLERLSLSWHIYLFWIISFSLPLFLSSSQIITGTLINCLLFLAAERLSKKEIVPLVILPSLGAICHGVLFGPQTIFLYYFLPFIWLGNYVLIEAFSRFSSLPYIMRICVCTGMKYLILWGFAQISFQMKIVPRVFVASMGYMQLITAVSGGILAYGLTKLINYERNRNTN